MPDQTIPTGREAHRAKIKDRLAVILDSMILALDADREYQDSEDRFDLACSAAAQMVNAHFPAGRHSPFNDVDVAADANRTLLQSIVDWADVEVEADPELDVRAEAKKSASEILHQLGVSVRVRRVDDLGFEEAMKSKEGEGRLVKMLEEERAKARDTKISSRGTLSRLLDEEMKKDAAKEDAAPEEGEDGFDAFMRRNLRAGDSFAFGKDEWICGTRGHLQASTADLGEAPTDRLEKFLENIQGVVFGERDGVTRVLFCEGVDRVVLEDTVSILAPTPAKIALMHADPRECAKLFQHMFDKNCRMVDYEVAPSGRVRISGRFLEKAGADLMSAQEVFDLAQDAWGARGSDIIGYNALDIGQLKRGFRLSEMKPIEDFFKGPFD